MDPAALRKEITIMQLLRAFFLAVILALSTVPAPQTQEQSPPQKKTGALIGSHPQSPEIRVKKEIVND
jgi:hypothetical protein